MGKKIDFNFPTLFYLSKLNENLTKIKNKLLKQKLKTNY